MRQTRPDSMDRIRWEPAIYEHKAALINRSVDAVSSSASLLVEALHAEHETYQADYLTVGVDIYNVEAEACGATVRSLEPTACPEIVAPLWDIAALPHSLTLPDIPNAGRFPLLLEAGSRIVGELGRVCHVRLAVSGPVSIAGKLVGLESLITALALEEESAETILDFSSAIARRWCQCLRSAGLEVIIFDSAAAPPMFSPDLYRRAVLPRHQELLSQLQESGQVDRPLIVGGDTIRVVSQLARSGATVLLCDSIADAPRFAAALPHGTPLTIRRNINPRVFADTQADLAMLARSFHRELSLFARAIAGTGILPYHTDPARFQLFRRHVDELCSRAS